MGIVSVSLQTNIEQTIEEIREKTGACFTLEGIHDYSKEENVQKIACSSDGGEQCYYIGPDVDQTLVNDVIEQESILGYDLYGNVSLYFENGKVFQGFWSNEDSFFSDGQKEEELSEGDLELLWYGRMARHHLRLKGHTDVSKAAEFRSGNYELVEGKFPSVDNRYEILISDDLAELNGFQVGDFLSLSQKTSEWDSEAMGMEEEDYFENEKGPFKCKIVGIYKINVGGEYSDKTFEEEIPENAIYGNYTFLDELKDPLASYDTKEGEMSHRYLNATFFVENAKQLDKIISNLHKNKVIDETYFKIYKDNSAFAKSAGALKNMRLITWIMTIIVLGGGIVLLLLLEKMWLEGRRRETGIYLAAGIRKQNILYQYCMEMLLCLVPALLLSIISSLFVAPKLGQYLLQASGGVQEILLTDWKLEIGIIPIIFVVVGSVLICMVGTLIPGKKVVEMQPRDLFTNLSIQVKEQTGWKRKREQKERMMKRSVHSRWDTASTHIHYDCGNWIVRTFVYLIRNRKKAIGMFLILFITSLLLLSSLVIREAANKGKGQLASTIGASFQIKTAEGQEVTQNLSEEVGKMEGIQDYNTTSISYSATKDLQLIPGQFAGSGEIWEKVPRVISCNESSLVHFFRDGEVKIKEGRQVGRGDDNTCLISEELAEQNGLSIGDSISLWLAKELDPAQEKSIDEVKQVEIVGIYSIEVTNLVSDAKAEADKYANMIFTDEKTGDWIQTGLYGRESGQVNDNAEFILEDPDKIDSIFAKIQEKYGVTKEQLVKNDKEYQESAESLTQLDSVMEIMEKATIFISLFVLALILTLWTRERIQEIGIYLANGIEKRIVMLQMLIEKLMIGLLSFLTAAMVVAILGKYLEQWMQNSLTEKASQGLAIIQVMPDMKTLLLSFLMELVIILFSVIISLLSVMRLKPKNILSQMRE